ncbi:phosphatidylinositol 4-phosphate 5-kinase-like protein 1 [Esox lucius]|uniref:PIPK domain-containing protein n=1 Tax=Esox lucius TaxID=8010 RepID=A0A3P8X7N2_ESOLU|nr:phosphatidylinositol 4-phosphate 5-kinase-like protein 1 [Esox lucius]
MKKRSGLRLCTFGTARQRRWWGLRTSWIYIYVAFTFTWRMSGLFNINQEHDFYSLTCLMKEGLHAVLLTSNDTPRALPEELSAEHYKSVETQVHKDLEMRTFAGLVFASLRRSLDITEEDYQRSLSSEGCYVQFISNSKSKADFFLTNDKRFFLKTQNMREVTFFLSNLKAYMDHLKRYPHSLMVRFLGLYSIQIPNKTKTYFIVMQNVFYPDEKINTRYDIKGCEVGRWTDPASTVTNILKDNNFEGKHIILDQQRSWLVDQVEIDSAFLRSLNVLDYSILLAHQPLHQHELDRKHSFSNQTMATANPKLKDPSTIPLEVDSAQQASDAMNRGSDQMLDKKGHFGQGIPLRAINRCSVNGTKLWDFQANHRRLPNFSNSVHVIDGPKLRYFVGIVDFFTVYGVKKRQENLWKSLRFPGRAFSTVSPATYSQRFCQWVRDHTK